MKPVHHYDILRQMVNAGLGVGSNEEMRTADFHKVDRNLAPQLLINVKRASLYLYRLCGGEFGYNHSGAANVAVFIRAFYGHIRPHHNLNAAGGNIFVNFLVQYLKA